MKKMQFNCDKTEEVLFSVKRSKIEHPTLNLGSNDVKRTDEHKHRGLIPDSQLTLKVISDKLYQKLDGELE